MEALIANERELLAQVAQGQQPAFETLVHAYRGKVYNFIKSYAASAEIAEEIVQDIFTQVWLARDTLPEIRKFNAFLFTVARNYALNCLKKYLREKKKMDQWRQSATLQETPKDFTDDFDIKLGLIERAVSELPEQQQKVWIMARQKGLPHRQIAEELGLTTNTVKKYMQLAVAFVVDYAEKRLPVLVALAVLEKI